MPLSQKCKQVKAPVPRKGTTRRPTPSSKLLSSAVTRFGSASTQMKEVLVSVKTYPDYSVTAEDPKGVYNFWWSGRQEYFNPPQSGAPGSDTSAKAISRPKSVKVSALPRAVNAGNATSAYLAQYQTPVVDVQPAGEVAGSELSGGQVSNTIVHPNFNVDFVLLGETNLEKMDTTFIAPATASSRDPEWLLFQLRLLDATTGAVITDPVQLCVEVLFYQTIPVVQSAKVAPVYTATFGKLEEPSTAAAMLAQVQLRGIRDRT